METPAPFDLNEAIRQWQKNLRASPAFSADNLEEMASHLRDSVQKFKATGLSDYEAFEIAVQRIGERGQLEREYAKVNPAMGWSLSLISFWIVAGIYLLQISYSIVLEVLYLRRTSEMNHFLRFIAAGASRMRAENSLFDPLWWCVPELVILIFLALIFGARVASGSWLGVGALVRCFERPIRTSLDLIGLGLILTFLPGLLFKFPGYWFFLPGAGLASGGYLTGAAVNVALVLSMVLLARPALRERPLTNQFARTIQFQSK